MSAISKATEAVLYVRKHLAAGNQLGSVISTDGKSTVKLRLLRAYEPDLIAQLQEKLKNSMNGIIRATAGDNDYFYLIRPYVSAQMALELKTGNCGEFADLVFKYLVETSGNKLHVYACSFAEATGADHAFNLIYDGAEALFANTAAMDTDKTIVADAWMDVKCKLSDYLSGKNPYRKEFVLNDIVINHKSKGICFPIFSKDVLNSINIYVNEIRKEIDDIAAATIAERARMNEPIDGIYGFVDEKDPKTYTVPYIVDKLYESISGRNFLLHSISLQQRKDLFAVLRIVDMTLYEACKKLYNTTEWHDIVN